MTSNLKQRMETPDKQRTEPLADPRWSEHLRPGDAIAYISAYMRDECTEQDLLALPSIEDQERRPLLWWHQS